MNLLIPCAGRSSRFHTRVPKYLLAMPDRRLMVEMAAAPFLPDARRVLIAVLREHEEAFGVRSILARLLPQAEVMVLDEVTRGQSETIKKMLEHFDVHGPFLVKDSDSYFEPVERYEADRNYISVCSAREVRQVKLYNKSFAVINEQGYVVGAVEKEITSEFFSCGGYHFASPAAFVDSFDAYVRLQTAGEFYLSQIIDLMIENGHIFFPMACRQYEDWGTHEDWIAYRKRISTYLFDIDGVIYENGGQYIAPLWGENRVLPEARDKVAALHEAGNYIVLVTTRPESFRAVTEEQLRRDGVPYHQLVMGVYHGTRVVVNDFGPTNPYPSAVAINTLRDSADYLDKI